MRSIAVITLSVLALSCSGTNADEARYREPVAAISSLAEALARNSDNYRTIISNRQIAGNRLQADVRGQYYFEYGILGRCYPRDNSQDIDENGPVTSKVNELTCFQDGAFDVTALADSFGQIYLRSPNPDEIHRRLPTNIPKGDQAYQFGTARSPSGVTLELTATAPNGLQDALFQGGRLPMLSGPILRSYAGKIRVREVWLGAYS